MKNITLIKHNKGINSDKAIALLVMHSVRDILKKIAAIYKAMETYKAEGSITTVIETKTTGSGLDMVYNR